MKQKLTPVANVVVEGKDRGNEELRQQFLYVRMEK